MNRIEHLKALLRLVSERSVSTKIAAGFAIVLLLHLSVVFMGHYGLKKAEHDQQIQATLLDRVETFFEIDRTVDELQHHVLLFAFTGYEAPAYRVRSLQERLEATLEQAGKFDDTAGVQIDHYSVHLMREGLARHREIFELVVADREKRRRIVDRDLVDAAHEFELELELLPHYDTRHQRDLYAAEAAFHAAQLKALRFIRNPDGELVEQVKYDLNDSRQHLLQLQKLSRLDLEAAIQAIDQYKTSFIQMVQSTRGYLHLVNVVLAGESAEFLYQAADVREACACRAQELTEEMRADSQRFEVVNNVVSVLTIVLGLLASWLIGRDVAPPLNAITETIDGLAQGQKCDSVPGLERGDELGRLARAAEVFRTKAAETERLLAEVTRMKESERQSAHSQKMESIGQLAAGIAHEINTPMQSIANNVQFLAGASRRVLSTLKLVSQSLQEPDAGTPEWCERMKAATGDRRFVKAAEQMPEAIQDTSSASQRVVDIVRAMKAMSHPGKTELSPVDVNQVIRDATTISRNRWKYAADLDLELDENLPAPAALGSVLSQVVLNLVVNSADAITENQNEGDSVGNITVRTYADAESVFIEVQDTGGGVPEAIQERIFDPFFTTKEVGKGTGQGLAFCYDAVVKRHQGELRLNSKPGVGTTFTVRLPMNPEAAEIGSACTLDAAEENAELA